MIDDHRPGSAATAANAANRERRTARGSAITAAAANGLGLDRAGHIASRQDGAAIGHGDIAAGAGRIPGGISGRIRAAAIAAERYEAI